jgi:hypothetical protein
VGAGVPHVVSVQCARAQDDAVSGLVTDRAARVFCSAFYLALLLGKTVLHAFEIGRARVAADASVQACQVHPAMLSHVVQYLMDIEADFD